MENIDLSRPFLIEINGQFVANPPSNTDNEDRVQASVGDRRDAAVFKLEQGVLRRADENNGPLRFLGRFVVEPLIYAPLPVYWVTQPQMVKRCNFTGDESSPQTLNCEGIFARCYM